MNAQLLDAGAWECRIILAQDDHAAFTRNVALHETLRIIISPRALGNFVNA